MNQAIATGALWGGALGGLVAWAWSMWQGPRDWEVLASTLFGIFLGGSLGSIGGYIAELLL